MTQPSFAGATLDEMLAQRGVNRRAFLKFCTAMASMMALPPSVVPGLAQALANARRPSVIWLSFQECTGCTESLTRADSTTLEELIFNLISLDYHHTLQAAAGTAAEDARKSAMKDNFGKYLLLVDGSVPTKDGGVYSCFGGASNYDVLMEAAPKGVDLTAVRTHILQVGHLHEIHDPHASSIEAPELSCRAHPGCGANA